MGRLETQCEQEQKRALEAENKMAMVGVFMPVCDLATGKYTPKQCHGSTGYCWCIRSVDTGEKIDETMVPEMLGT